MPAPLLETTNELIELARKLLREQELSARTGAHRGALAFWYGGAAIGTIAIWIGSSSRFGKPEHAIGAYLVIASLAVVAVICIFQVYLTRAATSRRAKANLEHLSWIEKQARAGVLTNDEARAEILNLVR